jgi:predicted flap endonuclease-1-like 5' DNA nuclease
MDSTAVGLIVGLILVIITLFLIFWGRRNENAQIEASHQSSMAAVIPEKEAMQVQVPSEIQAPVTPAALIEDLTLIEGIGPKIAAILKQNGTTSFAQLAAMEIPALEKLLKENGLQFAKPGSWPEQARLAAAGKLDELKALQDKLVAGR